jgi:hypothetical protein
VEFQEFVHGGLPNDSFEQTFWIYVRFNGSAVGQMGGGETWGEDERIGVVGKKARRKETTRKSKT